MPRAAAPGQAQGQYGQCRRRGDHDQVVDSSRTGVDDRQSDDVQRIEPGVLEGGRDAATLTRLRRQQRQVKRVEAVRSLRKDVPGP